MRKIDEINKYPTQQQIINYMKKGWELGSSSSAYAPYTWLQKGGCGKGGETIKVHGNTFQALRKRDLLIEKYAFPTCTYILKETV